MTKTILVIGTYDTKIDELVFLESAIREQGANVKLMDISVLGNTEIKVDVTKHDVAEAAALGTSIALVVGGGNIFRGMALAANGSSSMRLVFDWASLKFFPL